MKLTELVQLSNEVRLALVEANGELTDETCVALLQLEDSLPKKVDGYAYLVDDLAAQAEQFKAKADEFKRLQKACENYVDGLKERLKLACIAMDVKELKGNDHYWKLQDSTPSVDIGNEERSTMTVIKYANEHLVPSQYKTVVQTISIDKKKILSDIKGGIEVQGCKLVRNQHVRKYLTGAKK